MEFLFNVFARALLMSLLALVMLVGAANAQITAPSTKSKPPHTKNVPPAPPVPDLEPKAIELLKATSARLAAAHRQRPGDSRPVHKPS